VQKRNIEKALNLKEVSSSSFDEVANIFSVKIEGWKKRKIQERETLLDSSRNLVFSYCLKALNHIKDKLEQRLNSKARISIESCDPSEADKQHFYYGQIIKYAKKHDYYFNRSLPKAWLTFRIELTKDKRLGGEKRYQLGVTIHHYGYDDSALAIGAFLEDLSIEENSEGRIDATLPLEIKPHVISISKDIESKEKNIHIYLENAVTLTLAQIASEL